MSINTNNIFVQQEQIRYDEVVQEFTNRIANTQEVFDKSTTQYLTPYEHDICPRNVSFSWSNSVSGLTQILPTRNELLDGTGVWQLGVNLFQNMLSTNESITSSSPIQFYDKNNTVLSPWLDQINDRLIFPSNLYTFNQTYKQYAIRVICQFRITGNVNGNLYGVIRLNRYNFNINNQKIITNIPFQIADATTNALILVQSNFLTFVNTETDPFLDGVQIDCVQSIKSTANNNLLELNSASV